MEKECSVTIWGPRVSSWKCTKKATIEREGKSYCTIHDPKRIAAKDKERDATEERERITKILEGMKVSAEGDSAERMGAYVRNTILTDALTKISAPIKEENI